MNDNLSLAMKVRDVCLQNKARWKIRINGSVELEACKEIPRNNSFYRLRAEIRGEDELKEIEYRLKYKRAPD